MLEDDARLAVDDALHLEAQRRRRAFFDHAEAEVDLLGRGPALVHLAQLVDLDAETVGQHLDHAAPRERQARPGINSNGLASSALPKPIVSNSTVGCS